MQPYNINFYKKAEDDLNRIIDYMLYTLYSKQAAYNFYRLLKKKVALISKDPYLYQSYTIDRIAYRFVNVNKYMIAYRIDEQTHTVHIIAIGHSLQKRKNIIKPK